MTSHHETNHFIAMNINKKRHRQLSIAESFQNLKKTKYLKTSEMENEFLKLEAASVSEKREMPVTEESSPVDNGQSRTVNPFRKSTTPRPPLSDSDNSPVDLQITEEFSRNSAGLESSASADLFPDIDDPLTESEELVRKEEFPESSSQGSAHIEYESPPFGDSDELQNNDENSESNQSEEQIDEEEEEFPISILNRAPECSTKLPKLEPSRRHTILFSVNSEPGKPQRAFPKFYRDIWDTTHVRMPCSPENRYPVEISPGSKRIKSRWDLICYSLQQRIGTSQDLENAIMKYNTQYRGKWNFNTFHHFFDTCFTQNEYEHFFETILPVMISMTLELPNVCTQPIPLLKKHRAHSITMSQKQIACLLLNAFFCTFPRRSYVSSNPKYKYNTEYESYPDINFNRLYYGFKGRIPKTNVEKLKCIVTYFNRIVSNELTGSVTFFRQSLTTMPQWRGSRKGLKVALVRSEGFIETEGHGMLQVDFANRFVGGGVLGSGCVQEEIRFVTCPELIVSRLFVESLGPTEVLKVTGVEQFSEYEGYGDTFEWKGSFQDTTPKDLWGRKNTQIVAMDALHFRSVEPQFRSGMIERELNKAYCGFYEDAKPENLSAIATGNWGCGAFNGDPRLKFIIQLMAASQAGRNLIYFTFGSKRLQNELRKIYKIVAEKNLCVGDLWRILLNYCNTVQVRGKEIKPSLGDFLYFLFASEDEPMTEPSNKLTDSDENALKILVETVENEEDDEETLNGDTNIDAEETEAENTDTLIGENTETYEVESNVVKTVQNEKDDAETLEDITEHQDADITELYELEKTVENEKDDAETVEDNTEYQDADITELYGPESNMVETVRNEEDSEKELSGDIMGTRDADVTEDSEVDFNVSETIQNKEKNAEELIVDDTKTRDAHVNSVKIVQNEKVKAEALNKDIVDRYYKFRSSVNIENDAGS